MKWKNRIVETGIANPSELIANPVNFRKHPKRQQEAINGSLDALGWIQNVIVNKRTGRIIDGHLRVDQAIAHGEAAVPVQWVDLSEEEEGQALLSLDPIAAMAETHKQTMTDIMKQINATQDALAPYLEEIAKSSGIDIGDILGKDEDDPPDESEAESFREKWGVERGQMWELGEHRVLCGDCTDNELIARLISGEDIDLCLTDPPYGIDYGRAGGFSASHGWHNNREKVEWDVEKISNQAIINILNLSKYQIIWGGNYYTDILPPTMGWLVWDKVQWTKTMPRMLISIVVILGAFMWDTTYGQDLVCTYKLIGWFISGVLLASIAENGYHITKWSVFPKVGQLFRNKVKENTGLDVSDEPETNTDNGQ